MASQSAQHKSTAAKGCHAEPKRTNRETAPLGQGTKSLGAQPRPPYIQHRKDGREKLTYITFA